MDSPAHRLNWNIFQQSPHAEYQHYYQHPDPPAFETPPWENSPPERFRIVAMLTTQEICLSNFSRLQKLHPLPPHPPPTTIPVCMDSLYILYCSVSIYNLSFIILLLYLFLICPFMQFYILFSMFPQFLYFSNFTKMVFSFRSRRFFLITVDVTIWFAKTQNETNVYKIQSDKKRHWWWQFKASTN
jgi:hypothetical protein